MDESINNIAYEAMVQRISLCFSPDWMYSLQYTDNASVQAAAEWTLLHSSFAQDGEQIDAYQTVEPSNNLDFSGIQFDFSGIQLIEKRPPQIPSQPADKRFHPSKRYGRCYVCDNCNEIVTFNKQAFPFDGDYVNKTWPVNTSPEDLKVMWQSGSDLTWWCSSCHRRDNESLAQVRERLGLYCIRYRKMRSRG